MRKLSWDPRQLTFAKLVRPFNQLPDDALLDRRIAAITFNVSQRTLLRHIGRGLIRTYNRAGEISKAELVRWFRKHGRTIAPGRPRKEI